MWNGVSLVLVLGSYLVRGPLLGGLMATSLFPTLGQQAYTLESALKCSTLPTRLPAVVGRRSKFSNS